MRYTNSYYITLHFLPNRYPDWLKCCRSGRCDLERNLSNRIVRTGRETGRSTDSIATVVDVEDDVVTFWPTNSPVRDRRSKTCLLIDCGSRFPIQSSSFSADFTSPLLGAWRRSFSGRRRGVYIRRVDTQLTFLHSDVFHFESFPT